MNSIWKCTIFGIILVVGICAAVPKYESPNSYADNQWRRAYYNDKPNDKQNDTLEESATTKERVQRLGYTTGYGGLGGLGGLGGYSGGSTGLSAYSPIKLDLGGVVLGTLVGIGAIIFIPKLISAFHTGYGGQYARSEGDNDLSSMASMLNKLDDILGQNNIDSTSCMQRAVCTYVRSTEYNMQSGSADQLDQLVHTLSENSLVDYLLDGTAIKEAIENGKNNQGKDCDKIYPSCPLDTNTAMNVVTKLLPKTS